MGRYLNRDKLAASGNTGTLTVRCFSNGLWWVCPDPKDKETVAMLQKAYSQGQYIHFDDIKITEEYYANDSNWN